MWQIAAVTGWSLDYILWGVNVESLYMMLSDAPHHLSPEPKARPREGHREAKVKSLIDYLTSSPTD